MLLAFGNSLRSIRHERLLTIEQIAEAAGVHANYIGSVERGERNLSLFNIWRIAAALGVSPTVLMQSIPKSKIKPAIASRSRP